ncbi:MAG TPA: hypothetical protein VIM57_02360 [Luteolibacter sp.]
MNLRLPSVVVLGALALTSCFPPEAPPRSRRSATGPSAAYRDDRYADDYGRGHDDAYDAPPPAPMELPRESPPAPVEPTVPPSNPSPAGRKEYPVAERTNKPDQVLSPYAPYNVIDVAGFKSGQLAKDPSNGKIFRVP